MGKYDDIIGLPHHVSVKHPQMPRANRAAQFAPFAALTGHDAAISETARLTADKIMLDDTAIEKLDAKLRLLADRAAEQPDSAITHFVPDEKKAGGSYITTVGVVKKVDDFEHIVVLMDGTRIKIEDIIEIDSAMFVDDV